MIDLLQEEHPNAAAGRILRCLARCGADLRRSRQSLDSGPLYRLASQRLNRDGTSTEKQGLHR
jgi:hypothetical protein